MFNKDILKTIINVVTDYITNDFQDLFLSFSKNILNIR